MKARSRGNAIHKNPRGRAQRAVRELVGSPPLLMPLGIERVHDRVRLGVTGERPDAVHELLVDERPVWRGAKRARAVVSTWLVQSWSLANAGSEGHAPFAGADWGVRGGRRYARRGDAVGSIDPRARRA